jgi:hypothetical protein
MVRRLVEKQQIGRLEEQPAQCDPATLAPRQLRDIGVGWRQPQGVHRVLDLGIQVPRTGGFDRVLHPGLLRHDGVHLLGRELFGKPGVDLVEPRQQGANWSHALLDVAKHGLRRVELRLLRQEADGVARR